MWKNPTQLSLFPMPLSLVELQRVFAVVDWGIVLLHPASLDFVTNFSPESVFKALLLPFVISITSDTALARELDEKDNLRNLCGFFGTPPPSAKVLSSFRDHPSYSNIMYQLFAELAIASIRLNLRLPYMYDVEQRSVLDEAPEIRLQNFSRTRVQYHFLNGENHLLNLVGRNGNLASTQFQNYLPNQGVIKNLDIPFALRIFFEDNRTYDFQVGYPDWLDPSEIEKLRGIDTLTEISSGNMMPYVACNVIVVDRCGNGEAILLAKRLNGYGAGEFGLPGGRHRSNETLEECAKRELYEETKLRLISSKPVSLRVTHFPDKPVVTSIGVLAIAYEGTLKNREVTQHGKWNWYKLDKLPQLLFEPSRLVIEDYVKGQLRNVQWDDIEWFPKNISAKTGKQPPPI